MTRVRPVPHKPCHRLLLQLEKRERAYREGELVIGTGHGRQYTEHFKQLTKDFYLDKKSV